MEKISRNEVKSISKQSNAVTIKRPLARFDILLYSGIFLTLIMCSFLIFIENARKNFFLFAIFLVMGIAMIVVSVCMRKKLPDISVVFYDGKMIFYSSDKEYYAITPSELIDFNISTLSPFGKQNNMSGILNLNCEFGTFNSLYVNKIHRLEHCLIAFKGGLDVVEENANYTPTCIEAIYNYIWLIFVSILIMLGGSLCFRVPSPWNIVVMIVFPLAGLILLIYTLVKIFKIRKSYKN